MTPTQEFIKDTLKGMSPKQFLEKLRKERNKIIIKMAAREAIYSNVAENPRF